MSDRELQQLRRLHRERPGDEDILHKLEATAKRMGVCPLCGAIPREDYTYCLACRPLCATWDSFEVVKYQAEFLREEEPELSEEEAFNQASQYTYEHEWEYVVSEIGQWIEELNPYELDWYDVDDEETTDWNPRIQQQTGTERYFVELGNAFVRTMGLENADDFTVCYDGKSLTVNTPGYRNRGVDRYVPAHLCEICDEPHPSEEAAENCCFLCEYCEDPYKTLEEAANCCFPCPHNCITIIDLGWNYGTREIPTVYKASEEGSAEAAREAARNCCWPCLKCEITYDTEEEAFNCDCT